MIQIGAHYVRPERVIHMEVPDTSYTGDGERGIITYNDGAPEPVDLFFYSPTLASLCELAGKLARAASAPDTDATP